MRTRVNLHPKYWLCYAARTAGTTLTEGGI